MSAKGQSYWIRSGILSILEKSSGFLFGFGTFVFLVRMVDKTSFGVWVLYYTVVSFIEVGRNGLLQNALVKYLSNADLKEARIINTASIALSVMITTGAVLFLAFAGNWLENLLVAPGLAGLLLIYCLTTVILVPQQQFTFIQQANLDFTGIFWSNFTLRGLLFVVVLLLFLSGWDIKLEWLAWSQVVIAFIAGVISYYYVQPFLHFSWKVDWKWVRSLSNFGLFTMGTNLSTMLYKTMDKMMLGPLTGMGAVAASIYENAIKITNMSEVPTFSIASIVFPQSARRAVSEGTAPVKELYEKSVGAILAIVLPFILLVFVFAKPIIILIATSAYLEAVPVLRVTIWFGLFIPFAVQFGTIIDSMGYPKVNFLFTIAGLLINVVLNYLFIVRFGVIGAAYGTLLSYFLHFVMTQIVLHRMIGSFPWNAFRHVFPFYTQGYKLALSKMT